MSSPLSTLRRSRRLYVVAPPSEGTADYCFFRPTGRASLAFAPQGTGLLIDTRNSVGGVKNEVLQKYSKSSPKIVIFTLWHQKWYDKVRQLRKSEHRIVTPRTIQKMRSTDLVLFDKYVFTFV